MLSSTNPIPNLDPSLSISTTEINTNVTTTNSLGLSPVTLHDSETIINASATETYHGLIDDNNILTTTTSTSTSTTTTSTSTTSSSTSSTSSSSSSSLLNSTKDSVISALLSHSYQTIMHSPISSSPSNSLGPLEPIAEEDTSNSVNIPTIVVDKCGDNDHHLNFSRSFDVHAVSLPYNTNVYTSLPDPRPFHVAQLRNGSTRDLFTAMHTALDAPLREQFNTLLMKDRVDLSDTQWVRDIARMFMDAPWLVEAFLTVIGWCGPFDPLMSSSPNMSSSFGPTVSPPGSSTGWFPTDTTPISNLVTDPVLYPMPSAEGDGFANFVLPDLLHSPVPSPAWDSPQLASETDSIDHHHHHHHEINTFPIVVDSSSHLNCTPPQLVSSFCQLPRPITEETDPEWEDMGPVNYNDGNITPTVLTPAKLISSYADLSLEGHAFHLPHLPPMSLPKPSTRFPDLSHLRHSGQHVRFHPRRHNFLQDKCDGEKAGLAAIRPSGMDD